MVQILSRRLYIQGLDRGYERGILGVSTLNPKSYNGVTRGDTRSLDYSYGGASGMRERLRVKGLG